MPRRTALPASLSDRPFSTGEAVALGVGRGRLSGSDLIAPFPAVRDSPDADADLRRRCEQFAARMKPWQFFSHETALALQGVPVLSRSDEARIHVSAHRPRREPRVRGVAGHRLQTREDAHVVVDGFRAEHVVRAWAQSATLLPHDALVAAGDHLVRAGLVSIPDLLDETRFVRGRPASWLRAAVRDIRFGSESPQETRLRLVLVRGGLPEPELNLELRDARGRFIARLDLLYRQWRVAVEYDGRQHAEDARQFERDADRWTAIRREGWDHVRILRHHLRGDGRAAVFLVREALVRAGWRA